MTKGSKTKEVSNSSGLSFFDVVKWALISLLLVGSLVANAYYEQQVSGAVRAAIGILLIIALLLGAYTTALGQQAWGFLKLSKVEMRKVIWPTKQETVQTTIMVVIIVLLAAIFLWLLDMLYQWFVYSFLLG